jgi:hypothetical protein
VGGSWSKSGENGLPVTGGHLFSLKCPSCGESLLSFPDGFPSWHKTDSSTIVWFPENPETRVDPRNAPELVLRRIQAGLTPEHELDIVAINMLTGEYVLGKTIAEAEKEFRDKWPDAPSYMCSLNAAPQLKRK